MIVSFTLPSFQNVQYFIFILRVIMSKILEQSKPNLDRFSKTFNKTKISFRSKPLTIRNIYHEYSQSHRNGNQQERSQSPINPHRIMILESPDKGNAEAMQSTCSTFMRNYIDKLKRQRKREKKKIESVNHSKPIDGSIGCDLSSLPSIPQANTKVLVLKKIQPIQFTSNLALQSPHTQTTDIEHLVQMIKQIKDQQKHHHRRHFSLGLPTLSFKQKKQKIEQNIEVLVEPWENGVDYQQCTFEQYK